MIVIADTGPLNYLVLIGEVEVLPPACLSHSVTPRRLVSSGSLVGAESLL